MMTKPLNHTQIPLFNFIQKIIIVGDSGCGKTNLLLRFTHNRFQLDSKSTIGVDFTTKNMTINHESVKVHLWDTAGQERYRSVAGSYYRGAQGIVIVFDVTNRETYTQLGVWVKQVRQYVEGSVPLLIIGNKIDLVKERKVFVEEALRFGECHGAIYTETSCLTGQNVDDAFNILIKKIHNISMRKVNNLTNHTIPKHLFEGADLDKVRKTKTRKWCC